jgi:hypothetical protein
MTTETETRVLTVHDAILIGDIAEWAIHNSKLLWLDDRGEVQTGTARSIGDNQGNLLGRGVDVRDAFLRITTAMGWEWFVPMAEVIERHRIGTMMPDWGSWCGIG